jgi:superfamily II DNA or RNA helicase
MSTVTPDLLYLLETMQHLLPEERAALSLLAVLYAPTARSTLAQCFQKAGIRSVGNRLMVPPEVLPLMNKLVTRKLAIDTGGSYSCNPLLAHVLVRQAQKDGLFERYARAVQDVIAPRQNWGGIYYRSFELCVQDIRIALYRGLQEQVRNLLENCATSFPRDFYQTHPLILICGESPDRDWLEELPAPLQFELIAFNLNRSLVELRPADVFLSMLEQLLNSGKEVPADALKLYLEKLLLRGEIRKAAAIMTASESVPLEELRGWLAVLEGDDARAIALFEQGLTRLKKETGKRKIFFRDLSGLFYLLTLIRSGLPHHLQTAVELGEWAVKQRSYLQQFAIWLLSQYAALQLGQNRVKSELVRTCNSEQRLGPVSQLIHSLIGSWLPETKTSQHVKALQRIKDAATGAGYLWIAAEADCLYQRLAKDTGKRGSTVPQLFPDEGIISLTGGSSGTGHWERALKMLAALGDATAAPGKEVTAKASRIAWLLSGNEHFVEIQPVEQKKTARGWSAGRNAALKRLKEEGIKLDFLTPQDREIVACIKRSRSGYGYYGREFYEFDTAGAIRAMAGHPLVFNALAPEEPITVGRGEFALEVVREKKNLRLRLRPSINPECSAFFQWEGTGRLLLFEPTSEQRRIAGIIGDSLRVPLEGEARVMAAITAISPHVTVHSDVAGENAVAEVVAADTRLQLMLRPNTRGISLEVHLLPLGDGGPRFSPGRGGATVIAEVKGKKLQTSRNLQTERETMELLLDHCPALELLETGDGIWRCEEPEEALDLLEELQVLARAHADRFCLNWPEGERLKLRGRAEWPNMKLSVHSGKDWFALEGEVTIGDNEVLSLQRLLELTAGHQGRFLQLADDEFLALTGEFRRKLEELGRLMEKNGRFNPLIAPLLEETLQGTAGLKGDKQWQTNLARFKSSQELEPHVPHTLQAELRDYQREGFDWLSRLAHWGVGACLADDMGLGKTVQALALLLTRAAAGPSLVLAPTSVCFNWESEARRFAPTLTPRIFGAGNRREFIDSLAPFDLVICSYTLFQQEAELLTGVPWETAVLDEAQAIKNMATKRSQAAMQIKAGFRLATSGTPVENRLDELWNLFRFLNPGLLGSHKSFTERFALPIEKHRDKTARAHLKKLIRPFILRRSKSQVLEELPPRTDILHRIELSPEEAAFYEALRRRAVETLSGADGAAPGERQIRILAEIMRLRRACCNPELVLSGAAIGSAKLAAFREIAAELRESGHRALVFSQFVDHLAILRRDLDRDGIPYQYLDGSTTPKERQQRVAAFQNGEGELFLISLKAGGVGLNLTGADYVIHMDPWWNPAVEDQASDRAHRIGQSRPVTVYRLVAANTIEEKIVALHHQKRDLADSLLEGTDTAARFSPDDLLELLGGGVNE